MSEDSNRSVPASPETQPADVRRQLDQTDVSHQGTGLQTDSNNEDANKYMGATEDAVAPVTPPMEGSAAVTSAQADADGDEIDPESELTPG